MTCWDRSFRFREGLQVFDRLLPASFAVLRIVNGRETHDDGTSLGAGAALPGPSNGAFPFGKA
jgi:hypothetical protein